MAYKITRFDSITLPHRMSTDDLSSGRIDGSLVQTLGGVYDVWGSGRRVPRMRVLRHAGLYAGSDDADLQSKLDALKGAVGTAGQIWRERHDGVEQWARARLLGVEHEAEVEHHFGPVADVSASFELTGAFWKADTVTTVAAGLANGATSVPITNSGTQDVTDAVVEITMSGAVSTIDIVLGDAHLTFARTFTGGEVLAIDCGQLSVQVDGVDAYDDFALGGNHAIDGWLLVPAGSSTMQVTTNGYGNIEIEFYTQYA